MTLMDYGFGFEIIEEDEKKDFINKKGLKVNLKLLEIMEEIKRDNCVKKIINYPYYSALNKYIFEYQKIHNYCEKCFKINNLECLTINSIEDLINKFKIINPNKPITIYDEYQREKFENLEYTKQWINYFIENIKLIILCPKCNINRKCPLCLKNHKKISIRFIHRNIRKINTFFSF